jgi:hypothetical protein
VKFVVCDDDRMMRSIVESIISSHGHQLVGVAENTMLAVELIERAGADVVVVDPSLGYNTDFDVVRSAIAAGAQVVVFSATADADLLQGYQPRPMVVPKPDFAALEALIVRLTTEAPGSGVGADGEAHEQDRRHRAVRVAAGPAPTGVHDAQAFYEAMNQAAPGDALASIEFSAELHADAVEAIADRVAAIIRETDRLLASRANVKLYLAGGGEPAAESFESRLVSSVSLPAGTEVRLVIVAPAESPNDAFDRLRRSATTTLGSAPVLDPIM